MSIYTTKAFWAATAERTVRTAAQTAIASIGTTALLHRVDWPVVASTAGLASVLAVLMAVATAQVGGAGPGITEEIDVVDARPEPRHLRR